MSRLRTALVIAAVIAGSALASSSQATPPGGNGRIAFMRKDAVGHWQIWVASRRLTGAKRLTAGPADSGWPVWSPDGTKIAFDSSRADSDSHDSTAINDLFVMNAAGTNVRKLTDSVGASADAAWSPDGSLIAFDADRGDPSSKQGIYTMRFDGSDVRRITTLPPGTRTTSPPASRLTVSASFSRASEGRGARCRFAHMSDQRSSWSGWTGRGFDS